MWYEKLCEVWNFPFVCLRFLINAMVLDWNNELLLSSTNYINKLLANWHCPAILICSHMDDYGCMVCFIHMCHMESFPWGCLSSLDWMCHLDHMHYWYSLSVWLVYLMAWIDLSWIMLGLRHLNYLCTCMVTCGGISFLAHCDGSNIAFIGAPLFLSLDQLL